VAGIVKNVRAVFPHRRVVGGELRPHGAQLGPPLVNDTAWVDALLGKGGARVAGHEYLMLDAPAQYFDRQVLGEAGVRLVQRSRSRTDDRPQLEYVAARLPSTPRDG
jgi:hypothetical protein